MKWYIGCSGFSNRNWKGEFYPEELPSSDWLEFYAGRFNSVEVNSTFYRMPRQSTLDKWFYQVSEDFIFTLKAPKQITHFGKFNETEVALKDFYEKTKAGLRHKLGPILFQLPPSFHFSKENLHKIIDQLDPDFKNVLEFRHSSWWNEEVFETFRKADVTFSGLSYPSPNLSSELIQTNQQVYYRLHGVPILYKSEYASEQLNELADSVPSKCDEAFIYFNNTWGLAGIRNALEFKRITEKI